jgi:hydroxymethylbilane synthase
MHTLVMGTRGSPLALAQSRQVAAALMQACDGLEIEERIITTTGDRQQGVSLPSIGGKGVFTLEIERALMDGSIDFAVHSLKDLPPELPAGLRLGAIPRRAPAHDVCVLKAPPATVALPLPFLKHGAVVGTSSLRRRAQLLSLRPDLEIRDVRGNIDTRLNKLQTQPFDAIVLAAAGLERLGVAPEHVYRLDEHGVLPAPGQGALALECRDEDAMTNALLLALEDGATRTEISAERALMKTLNAGCSTPLAARAICGNAVVALSACVLSADGATRIESGATGADARDLGESVARDLLDQGASALMGA